MRYWYGQDLIMDNLSRFLVNQWVVSLMLYVFFLDVFAIM